jgi:hypothetical protein
MNHLLQLVSALPEGPSVRPSITSPWLPLLHCRGRQTETAAVQGTKLPAGHFTEGLINTRCTIYLWYPDQGKGQVVYWWEEPGSGLSPSGGATLSLEPGGLSRAQAWTPGPGSLRPQPDHSPPTQVLVLLQVLVQVLL